MLLFRAFLSIGVTLIYSLVQRFEPHFFPGVIRSRTIGSVIVFLIGVALCLCVSLLGLTRIFVTVYGYLGYYAFILIVIPTLTWGNPKGRKASAAMAQQEQAVNCEQLPARIFRAGSCCPYDPGQRIRCAGSFFTSDVFSAPQRSRR